MNKAELLENVQQSLGNEASKADAERALDAVLNAIKKGLTQSPHNVQLIGFGTFKISERAARSGINPKTGETIQIKASKSVKFSPGKAFKESL